MSIHLVENEIRRLLSSKEPEVVCISGHWGVGKTYAWERYLKEAHKRQNGIALKSYSYVSLFGINSLDELKYSIFANGIGTDIIGTEPSLETFKTNIVAMSSRFGKAALHLLQQIPFWKNKFGGPSPLWFMSVSKAIVCLDDIERRGDKLSLRDVLGLVAHLKEQKQCKVIMILNDEKLVKDHQDFRAYFEKVIDVSLRFNPTPAESIAIALLPEGDINKLIGTYCIELGISNIRLIKKIERAVNVVTPILHIYDKHILDQAVKSLALLGWCVYEPGKAPDVAYVKTFNAYMIGMDRGEEVDETETSWNNTLRSFGFASMDEMDLTLLDGIRDGYFNEELLKSQASKKNKDIKDGNASDAFRQAWELFHGSFDNNKAVVLDGILASFKQNIGIITPLDLNGTVVLLKDLGRPEQAAEIIELYVASKLNSRDMFDLDNGPHDRYIRDPDVRAAFRAKLDAFEDNRNPVDILLSIASENGWSQADSKLLSQLTVDDYYQMFKTHKNDTMQRLIDACLFFEKGTDASTVIAARAKEALERIGAESDINACRVRRYGVRRKI